MRGRSVGFGRIGRYGVRGVWCTAQVEEHHTGRRMFDRCDSYRVVSDKVFVVLGVYGSIIVDDVNISVSTFDRRRDIESIHFY